jgi:hypothetical protein
MLGREKRKVISRDDPESKPSNCEVKCCKAQLDKFEVIIIKNGFVGEYLPVEWLTTGNPKRL